MIYCAELNKEFQTKDEMFAALKEDAKNIITQKTSKLMEGLTIGVSSTSKVDTSILDALMKIASKSFNPLQKSIDYTKKDNLPNLKVIATSSSTNWLDSHRDVHIDGCFDKTLKDKGQFAFPHIQEHDYDFESVIADGDNVKTYVENTTFKKLGFDYSGTTQALKFESTIDPNRNLFMYNQYANGWVKNHSVGMWYVPGKIVFCANSEMDSMQEEKANFDKYYAKIANKEDVDAVGYFWAILEIKLKEHSAVVFGSNCVTPTDSVEIEADKSLGKDQADKSLQKNEATKNYYSHLT